MSTEVSTEIQMDTIEVPQDATDVPKQSTVTPQDATETIAADNEFSYIDRDFTSEIYKIEVRNLGIFGISEFKKLLKNQFSLDVCKIKSPRRKEFAFLCFRNQEDKEKAMKELDGFMWKGRKMKVKAAKANPDPLYKRRREDSDWKAKRPKTTAEATCPLAHLTYEDQLKQKENDMLEILKKFGNDMVSANGELKENIQENGLPCEFLGLKSSPKIDGYRNKSEFTVGKNSEGEIVVGFRLGSYADGSVEVGSVDDLPHLPAKAKIAAKTFQEYVRKSDFKPFNPEQNSGHFRQLTVRTSDANDEIMLIAGIYSSNLSAEEIPKLKEEIKHFYENYDKKVFHCDSLYYQDLKKRTQGETFNPVEHLSGLTHITDVIHGLKFRVSPLAFFQINTPAAGVLYQQAIDLAAAKSNSTVLDICCGTGAIALCFAKHCKQVVGVECIADAIVDAKFNATENSITNCKFHTGNCDDYIQTMVREAMYSEPNRENLDLVAIVDPPRAGLAARSITAIRNAFCLKRLVYVACNPQRAAQNWVDLCRPTSKSYKGEAFVPKIAVAVDMFPHTVHTELVILFERKSNEAEETTTTPTTTSEVNNTLKETE